MIESYRVGITVFLNNLVGKGLKTLSSQMEAAQKRADLLQKDLTKLQRATGSQGVFAERAARAQAQAATHFDRAARAQDQLANKTNRLRDVQGRMATETAANTARQAQWQRRLDLMEQKRQLTLVTGAKRLTEQRQMLRATTNEGKTIREGFARKEEDIQRQLGHTWDKAGIAQNTLFQTRQRTQGRMLALDNEILAKEKQMADARRLHQKSSGYKEELSQLRQRREAMAANVVAAETRARVTGEQLAAKGGMLQAQRAGLVPARRQARAENLAERARIEQNIEKVKADMAMRLLTMDAARKDIVSQMERAGETSALNRMRLAEREKEISNDMSRTKQAAEAEIGKARMQQFEAAKANAVRNQFDTAERAVRAEQATAAATAASLMQQQGRAKLLMGGGAATAAGGLGLLALAHSWVPEAAEYQRSQQAVVATNPAMAGMFRDEAKRAVTGYAPFLGFNDATQTLLDLHKAFGDPSQAVRFMPSMTQLMASMVHVIPDMSPDKAREQAFSIAKALELFGAARPGPNHDFPQFDKYLDMMGRSILFSGGRLDGASFQSVAKFAGASVSSLSPEFLFEQLPWLMTAMQGGGGLGNSGTFGPGARIAALQRFIQGTGGLAKEPASLLQKMSLLQAGEFVDGKVKKKLPLVGADIGISNPFQWAQQVFVPAFEKTFGKINWGDTENQKFKYDGLDYTLTQLVQKATQGNQYAGSILSMFIQNRDMVYKEQGALRQQMYPSQVAKANEGAWSIVSPTFSAQAKAIGESGLGQGALGEFTAATKLAGDGLIGFNRVLADHPGYAKVAGQAVVELGTAFTALGSISVVVGAAKWFGAAALLDGIGGGLSAIGIALGAAAFGTAGTIAIGLTAVAAAIGSVWFAAKYFLDDDFQAKVNKKMGGWWEGVKDWASYTWQGMTGHSGDFPDYVKDKQNILAMAGGQPFPFPERSRYVIASGNLTDGTRTKNGENIPNMVMRPDTGTHLTANIDLHVGHRVLASVVHDAWLDDWSQPTSGQSAPDYKEIPTQSSGRQER